MLEEIKGLGPKTCSYLEQLNIYNLTDLISYYPYRYNYYRPTLLKDVNEEQVAVVTGTIASLAKVSYIKRNFNRISFTLNTNSELINVVIFNRAFIKPHLIINKTISVIGKYNKLKNTFMASDIRLKAIVKEEYEPVYHLISGIKKSNFNTIMKNALNQKVNIENIIPEDLSQKYGFIDRATAIRHIHEPKTNEEIKKAKLRLIYEELFEFMLKINYLKRKHQKPLNLNKKTYEPAKVQAFIESLPFTLTAAQLEVLGEIEEDFKSGKRMNRLLLGDVGSGKTIVAFLALYMNHLAGCQGILMAPTEILAEQHKQNMMKNFADFDLTFALITSSTKKPERELIISAFNKGEISVLIGTHSVLNEEIVPQNLGLVVTDEQHRFGVKQRKNLQQKGKDVDVLYLSATPIPRTLALTIYGDMDISQIKTKPRNNAVSTTLVKEKELKTVLNAMLDEIKAGHQIYVVAPLALENEENELEDVENLYKKLDSAFNHKIPMAIIHGKLKAKEKAQIMSDFKTNKTKILVSTTVIEVGIDVQNATTIVIFNAERFGLATLHQLRGRVGRNELPSRCFIISNSETERLKVLEESNDGFYISEKDFELRGSGNMFGVKQSGDMDFRIANLKTDFKILMQCKEDSEAFLEKNLLTIEQFPIHKKIIDSVNFID